MFKLYLGAQELGVSYRVGRSGRRVSIQRIDFATDEQRSAEYLAINPKGRVPTLNNRPGNSG